jgi:hypothetical protein
VIKSLSTARIIILVFFTVVSIGFQPASITIAQSDITPTRGEWISTFDFVAPPQERGFPTQPETINAELTFNITEDAHGMIGTINISNPSTMFGEWNATWTATIQSGLFSAQFTLPYGSGSIYTTWSGVFVSPSEVHGILSLGAYEQVLARDVQWVAAPVASQ